MAKTRWTIGRVRSIRQAPGSDCEAAYAIHFKEDDRADPQMVVEYASGGGGRYASATHARRAVDPFLGDKAPPKRLLVDRDGNARPRM